jgi:ribosome maturation factor RimP
MGHMKRQLNKKKSKGDRHPKAKVDQTEITAKVKTLAVPLCDAEGLELVHVEFQREAVGWVLRVLIDKPQGINLDDCAHISRQLGDLLDVSLEKLWPYNLEVSSPGAERPLVTLQDFERFQGSLARVKTQAPILEQRNFKGVLKGVSGEMVHLLVEDELIDIPFQEIVKAKLVA